MNSDENEWMLRNLVAGQTVTQLAYEFCFSRSVALVHLSEDKTTPRELASGVCIRLGEHYFIATAGHFLKNAGDPTNIFIVWASDEASDEAVMQLQIADWAFTVDPEPDVGFLLLDKIEASVLGKTFITEENIFFYEEIAKTADKWFAAGFPAENVETSTFNEQLSVSIAFQTFGTSQRTELQNPGESYIYLNYPRDTFVFGADGSSSRVLPRPNGMSGCGFWKSNLAVKDQEKQKGNPGLWTPDDFKLVGIDSSWHASKQYIKAVDIKLWAELVKGRYPEVFPGLNTG